MFGIAALWLTCSGWAHAWGGCKISDWPLEIPEGPDDWILTVRPAPKPRIVVQEVIRRAHSTAATVAPPPDSSAVPRVRRDWNAGRHPAANDRERLIDAVHDDDVAQISRYLRQPGMNLNAPIDRNVNYRQSRDLAAACSAAHARCELVTFDGLDHQLDDSAARTQLLRKSDEFLKQSLAMSR